MNARTRRRLFLLSTATLLGALSGYGRSAYAQQVCVQQGATSTFDCSGASTDTQDLTSGTTGVNDANVVADGTFNVNTALQLGVEITGDGALSYEDAATSSINAGSLALSIAGGATNGSVTVTANGTFTGGASGIEARNNGTGAVEITLTGSGSTSGYQGINASNNGTDLTITTDVGSMVAGQGNALIATNSNGVLDLNINGTVTGTNGNGIRASNAGTVLDIAVGGSAVITGGTLGNGISATNSGTDLNVTTDAGSLVSGDRTGITARNAGTGNLTIEANGEVEVTGPSFAALATYGIYARNEGVNLTVTTGADSTVTGFTSGIRAENYGSGVLSVTVNGEVMGLNSVANNIFAGHGIVAWNRSSGTNLLVTTGADSTVTGVRLGIDARNYGTGVTTITANGNVTGNAGAGISVLASATASDITVTTAVGKTVEGSVDGISAITQGAGNIGITADGTVTGTARGIEAVATTASSGNITVTTGVDSTVNAVDLGIFADNSGSGATTIIANGDVIATGGALSYGIGGINNGDSLLSITTGEMSMVSGERGGVVALQHGNGELRVIANGTVAGTNVASIGGISATNNGNANTNITTGANSNVSGGDAGILARQVGNGVMTIRANGDVTGTDMGSAGIDAESAVTGFDLNVITGAGSDIQGDNDGIDAVSLGSGSLMIEADGIVAGANNHGINATSSFGSTFTITTGANSDISGAVSGIEALNNSNYSALVIEANGGVVGGSDGIHAQSNGTGLTITTGAGSNVSGDEGIDAFNAGGALSVTANGTVTGTEYDGISAYNYSGTNLTVTTGAGSNVTGDDYGINADNGGTGTLRVTANGMVTGDTAHGIGAENRVSGTDLIVTTGANSNVSGDDNGIDADNDGSGLLSVTANGIVDGTTGDGIHADSGGNGLTITTGTGSNVSGDGDGIDAFNNGGALSITANGIVTGSDEDGIFAINDTGTDLTVMTGAGSEVTGNDEGINVTNSGSGTLRVTANGIVTGATFDGISAENSAAGTDLIVTTGASSNVTGYFNGIDAANSGSGSLSITANGMVTGTTFYGINAENSASGTDLIVTTGASSNVTGNFSGIDAANSGSGTLRVTANGMVTGTAFNGIDAQNSASGTDLIVTTGAGSTVSGSDDGIRAVNNGSGTLSITANGIVTGSDDAGIFAINTTGTDLTVVTGAGSDVTGDDDGIFVTNGGTGMLSVTANGTVTGTGINGISATNSATGTDLIVTTGAGSTVTGSFFGINVTNNGSGTLRVTANGDVTGTSTDGIRAVQTAGGPIDITVGSGSTVTSTGTSTSDFAIQAFGGRVNTVVAGTLNGGVGGAITFDQIGDFDDRLELHSTAVINGTVSAEGGTDTLAFGGTGDGDFDLSAIDTGGNTQQYREFEIFQVDSGVWSFSGETPEAFAVNGGTLKGTGTFGGLTVNGGTLAPGNSIGTLTVNGVFTLGAGATYEVEVNAAGENDQVVVIGTVNITGATLSVLAATGEYNTTTEYVIIDNDGADAVNGTFATITSSLAFLIPTVIYNGGTGNDVVLTLERNETMFQDIADTPNQKAVAGALDKFGMTDSLFLAVLNQTAAGARQAFDALSGEIHATVGGVLADDSRYVREAILGRLMQAGNTDSSLGAAGPQVASLDQNAMALGYDNVVAPSSELAFWTSAYGAWGDYDGNRNAATADRDLGGFVSGMDASIGGSWRVGLAAGASYASIDVDGRNSSADVDSFNLAGYAGGMAGAFALRGGGAWAWNDIDTSRAVIFPGFFEREKASYDADTSQIFGEVAYPTEMGGASIEPFAGLAYVSVDTDKFVERGARKQPCAAATPTKTWATRHWACAPRPTPNGVG